MFDKKKRYGLAKLGVKLLEGKMEGSFDIFTQSKFSMLTPQNVKDDTRFQLTPTETLGDILSQPHKVNVLRESSLRISNNIKYQKAYFTL